MLAALDIGNTNIVLALHNGEKWINSWRVYTDQKKTTDEYYVIFKSLLESSSIALSSVDRTIVSSVVPNLTFSASKNLNRLFNVNPIIVSHELNTGLIKESIPQELGSDLLCNLAYAHHVHKNENVMVVDFGTALTFSCVKKNGEIAGVAIVPGLITSVNALFGSTAQLPQVELKIPQSAIGRNSEDAIRSGIMYGYAGLVNSMIMQFEKELGERVFVISTGGLSKTIQSLIPRIDFLDKNHTLNGLKLISDIN